MKLEELVGRATAVGMAGMICVHGWGKQEVADQSHVEIDIQPPQHVRATVMTVSGSPVIATSGTVITVGSASYLLTYCASAFLVKPL